MLVSSYIQDLSLLKEKKKFNKRCLSEGHFGPFASIIVDFLTYLY